MRSRVAGGLVTAIALLVFFGLRSQVALLRSGHSTGIQIFSGHKAQKYTGWKVEDQEFQAYVDPKKARVVFYIMVAGLQELPGLDALLRNVYHVDHFFLVHLDVKAAAHVKEGVNRRILTVLDERGNGQVNIRLVDPATPITWGGFTMTLNAVHGITQALHWNTKWDYFINLSASDLPLLGTDEVAGILGEHKASNTSFIKGFKYEPSWEGYQFIDRREMFAEDQAVMRDTDAEKRWPWAILDAQKEMLTRPMPNLFTVHKGEFWVMLHRSMAEYVHKSPDNQARTLLAYFSGMIVSDEEFFQTVACNPHFPHDTLRTHNDNLRFVNWWGDQASPAIVPPFRAVAAANSGAMFGRKFSSSTDEGRDGIRWIESYLADDSRSKARVDRVKRRLAARMTPEGEAVGFCEQAQEKKPPEAFFAVEGDEEKLPEEFQQLPPRRGGGEPDEGQGGTWEDRNRAAATNEAVAAAAAGRGGGRSGGERSRRLSEGHLAATEGTSAWRYDDTGADEPPKLAGHGEETTPQSLKGEGSGEASPPAEIAASQVDSGDVDDQPSLEPRSVGDSGPDDEGGDVQDLCLQGDSTRTDLKALMAVNTPIPRGTTAANNYFRTQYLNKLGIWASKQAKHHLNSAPRTEARYKSNIGSQAAPSKKVSGDSAEGEAEGRVPASAPAATTNTTTTTTTTTTSTNAAGTQEGTATTSTPTTTTTPGTAGAVVSPERVVEGEGSPLPLSSAEDARGDRGGDGDGDRGEGNGPVLKGLGEATAVRRSTSPGATLDGAGAAAGTNREAEGAAPATASVAATAVVVATASAAPAVPTAASASAIERPGTGFENAAPAAGDRRHRAADGSILATDVQRRSRASRQHTHLAPSMSSSPPRPPLPPLPPPLSSSPTSPVAIASPLHGTIAAPAFPSSAASSSIRSTTSSSSSSSFSSSSSSISSRAADRAGSSTSSKAWSPPLRAVKPPRRDIRRDYLTNLGMKKAVVAGPGGTRTPPPMIRRSSFTQSVENPVEEQLKDPNSGDISFEDVLRVVGSILTGGGGGKKEREPRPCRTCERLKRGDADNGGSSASSSPPGRRLSNSSGHDDGGGGEEGEGVGGPCRHKHVDFAPVVSAVYVPVHSEYSDRVRRSYWNSAGEIREMVYRNMIEFDAEEYNWENVAEEEDMYFCEETGEFIHPIFFDSQEEAREVRASSSSGTSSEPDAEDHLEYINEGRRMPVMQRR
ncbi:unnamed protein product [Scytosiphon promiscuus]